MFAYWSVGFGLVVGCLALRSVTWNGSAQLHTIMEAMATLLAMLVGIIALVRYYSKKNNTFLFIGAGFLGTSLLDGYHAIVTSTFFYPYLPSELSSLIPWSWVASRQFLSLMLVAGWLAYLREQRLGPAGRISDKAIYLGTFLLTLASFSFFAFAPLPSAYDPELLFHRPEEFGPAILFAIALFGHLKKGEWRHSYFEHWLVLALIVSLVSQAAFMSLSGGLFDLEFDLAHLLKKVSYICVLTGLLISTYVIFRRAEEDRNSLSREVVVGKKIQEAAQFNEERLRNIVETAADGIITIDESGIVHSFNSAAERIFRRPSENVIGRRVQVLMPREYAQAHDDHLRKRVESGSSQPVSMTRELWGLRGDDSEFPLELAVTEASFAGQRLFTGIVRDITERKTAERKLLQHAERLAQSNAELEEFAAVASHDLQEPLRKVQAFSDRLHTKYADVLGEEGNDYLQRMQDAAGRMQTLIADLLSLSRVTRKGQSFTLVDLNRVVRGVLSDLEIGIKESGAKIEVGRLETVHADPVQMRQLFQNLLGNALKYRREGTALEIIIHSEICRAETCTDRSAPAGPALCRIAIVDNGIGFDQLYEEKIFGVFQRLHGRTKFDGTGVGLAICRKIVERHFGSISAEGRLGEGSIFRVTLPMTHSTEDRSVG